MAIHTQQSFSGFIATDPNLSFTSRGDARFYARVGQNHYRQEDDGNFTKTGTTFHSLVAFRATAERAYERFRKGDNFLAEGYVRNYEHEVDGQTQQAEEFVAKRIGHDLALTTYTVDRTPGRGTPEQGGTIESDSLDQLGEELTTPEQAQADPGQRRGDRLGDIASARSGDRVTAARSNPVSL